MKKILRARTLLPLLLFAAGCQEKPIATNARSSSETNVSSIVPGTNAIAATPADNTARNVRDRAEATLTPGDQGESAADRQTTQRIRRALVSGPGEFSMAAKNIKIITVNGKVTLRGPVKTEAEKAAIANLAKTVAGEANVDDQLEVKAQP
jgi:osmotically-inducible protein OsmY